MKKLIKVRTFMDYLVAEFMQYYLYFFKIYVGENVCNII